MKVTIDKAYPINAPASNGWIVLQDVKVVASCMPGAEITEQMDETHFKGQVKVKIGPATAAFKGEIELKSIDVDKRELNLLGKGSDIKGTSSATLDLIASIRDTGDGQCELVGKSNIVVNGKFASFGGRMMDSVSDRIIQQFADNFANKVISLGEGAEAEAAAAKVAEVPKEFNGLAFAWQFVMDFFKSLFGIKSKQA
ncbi:MAG: SRPBCC family protein [Proteobacteria bacterium]|nr:SRPBCC family protein [Pseudomonadota bacterium]